MDKWRLRGPVRLEPPGVVEIRVGRKRHPWQVVPAPDPALVAAGVRGVRVFRGYAGWGPGQLEGEIEAGAWLVLDSEPGDVFSSKPDELWRTVLRRQPGRLAWLADAPDDLSSN